MHISLKFNQFLSFIIILLALYFSPVSSGETSSKLTNANMKHILEHIQTFYVDEVNPQKLNSSAVDSVFKAIRSLL